MRHSEVTVLPRNCFSLSPNAHLSVASLIPDSRMRVKTAQSFQLVVCVMCSDVDVVNILIIFIRCYHWFKILTHERAKDADASAYLWPVFGKHMILMRS